MYFFQQILEKNSSFHLDSEKLSCILGMLTYYFIIYGLLGQLLMMLLGSSNCKSTRYLIFF